MSHHLLRSFWIFHVNPLTSLTFVSTWQCQCVSDRPFFFHSSIGLLTSLKVWADLRFTKWSVFSEFQIQNWGRSSESFWNFLEIQIFSALYKCMSRSGHVPFLRHQCSGSSSQTIELGGRIQLLEVLRIGYQKVPSHPSSHLVVWYLTASVRKGERLFHCPPRVVSQWRAWRSG